MKQQRERRRVLNREDQNALWHIMVYKSLLSFSTLLNNHDKVQNLPKCPPLAVSSPSLKHKEGIHKFHGCTQDPARAYLQHHSNTGVLVNVYLSAVDTIGLQRLLFLCLCVHTCKIQCKSYNLQLALHVGSQQKVA